jgi:CRP-like cAMP-binding protein
MVPDDPIEYVYFPRTAVLSMLVRMEEGKSAEGATLGNEGLIGVQLFLGGGEASEETVVEIGGQAARVRSTIFRQAIERSVMLRMLLQRYALALMNQLAWTSACNRLHSVDERCARWLLMSRDRVGQNAFPLTHERLALILGVRRASVTVAAAALHRAGVIDYHRGWVTILDSHRLESAACEDYRHSRDGYERMYANLQLRTR